MEHDVQQYEVRNRLNRKTPGLHIETNGGLLMEVEDAIDTIPAPAKPAILKNVGGGKPTWWSYLTRPAKPV
jgi:hypothetical protein